MISRRFVLSLFALLPLLSVSAAKADIQADAKVYIQKLADNAMSSVATKTISEEERAKRFRTLFLENFDLNEIGKLVLARHWKTATPEQQAEFSKLFEEIQVLTWAKRFRDYAGDGAEVVGTQPEGDADIMVESKLKRDKLDPVAVGWRVRKIGDNLRVVDIKVEGASMALTHRSDYSAVIQAGGGKFDALLDAMRKKLTQLQSEKN